VRKDVACSGGARSVYPVPDSNATCLPSIHLFIHYSRLCACVKKACAGEQAEAAVMRNVRQWRGIDIHMVQNGEAAVRSIYSISSVFFFFFFFFS